MTPEQCRNAHNLNQISLNLGTLNLETWEAGFCQLPPWGGVWQPHVCRSQDWGEALTECQERQGDRLWESGQDQTRYHTGFGKI